MLHLKSSQWSTGKALVGKGGEKWAGAPLGKWKLNIATSPYTQSFQGCASTRCLLCLQSSGTVMLMMLLEKGAASTFYLHDAVPCVTLSQVPLDVNFTLLGSSDHVLPHHIIHTHRCSPFVRKEQLLVTLCWHLNTCETEIPGLKLMQQTGELSQNQCQ